MQESAERQRGTLIVSQQNSLGRGAMKAVTVSGPSRGQSNKHKPLISVRRLCLRWSRPGITGKGSIQSSLGMAEEPSWVARASGLGVSPRDGSDTLSADFRTGASGACSTYGDGDGTVCARPAVGDHGLSHIR